MPCYVSSAAYEQKVPEGWTLVRDEVKMLPVFEEDIQNGHFKLFKSLERSNCIMADTGEAEIDDIVFSKMLLLQMSFPLLRYSGLNGKIYDRGRNKTMGKLFSDQPVNTGRQVEFDLAKCSAIFFMIFLHCYFAMSYFDYDISLFLERGIAQLVGGPFAAPVFMFTMGVGMVYSRHQEPRYLIVRGIKLLQLGFFVNIGEFFVPYFLAGNLMDDWERFPIANGLLLFCIDILAFAGMAFILVGILKKLKVSAKGMVIVSVILSVIGWIARFHDFGSNVANLIAGYFVGSAGGFTAFPLFSWFIFPAAGLLFGEYYMRCTDKKRFLRFWPLALVISVAYFVISWFLPNGFLSEMHIYWFMTTYDAVSCLLCIYGVIGACLVISEHLPDGAIKFVSKSSSNLNTIYVIQWFIIPITYVLIVYFNREIVFGDASLIIIGLCEMAASILLASGYKNLMK